MRDLRARLERLGGRIRPLPDALERLERRRRRRSRNRRIGTAVVALAVALAGSLVAFTALRSRGPRVADMPDEPSVATISCDGQSTQVETPVVATQSDGVHVRVTNTSSVDLSLQFEGIGGDNAPVGENEVVWPIEPGAIRLRCADPNADAGLPGGYQTVQVVDPGRFFVPTELGCSSISGMTSDYVAGAIGTPGDPADVARDQLTGLVAGDVVERGGYSGSAEPLVRVVRDGRVIARLTFQSDGAGGWLLSTLDRCIGPETNFGWAATPYPRGAFEWCPEPPFPEAGRDWSDGASEVAVGFAEAYAAGDAATVSSLLDPSVPPDADFPVVIAAGVPPMVFQTSAAGGDLVRFGCGPDVDAYSVAVTIDDGSDSASADFTLFLVLREDGWKVWAGY